MNKFTAALAATSLAALSSTAFAAAGVTIGHFAPFAATLDGTSVTIRVNGDDFLENVKFKDFTPQVELDAGEYTIDIVPTGTDTVAITATVTVEDGKNYILYATGNNVTQDLELRALSDDVDAAMMGNLNLKIVHSAPFAADSAATEVSIRTNGGDVVGGLTNVPYNADSGFLEIPAANYNLKVATPDGGTNLIDIKPLDLPEGADITVFAVGDGINQPLGIIAVPVGELETQRPLDNRSNGLWTILNTSGVGLVMLPMPQSNRLVGKWYQPDANGNPTYFFFDSCLEETNDEGEFECSTPGAFDGVTATNSLYNCPGGSFDGTSEVECSIIGQLDVDIVDCDDMMVTVRLTDADPAVFDARNMTSAFLCSDDSFASE